MKTLIFDFDGTLADTFPVTMDILDRIGKYYGLPKIEESEYDSYRIAGPVELMKTFNMNKLKLIVFALHIKYLMKRDLKEIKLFNGVKELLEYFDREGYRIFIFSSNNQKNISKILRNNNVKKIPKVYTEISLINKGVGLKRLLNQESLSFNETIYIGDEVRDYDGAVKAGLQYIGVSWGYNSREGLVQAGVKNIVTSFDQLREEIKRLQNLGG